jgi:2-beta-glucuronyltransferase
VKRAVILTGHFPRQKRRGSLLWVADHLQAMGWHVTQITVGYSWLSYLRGDARLAALGYQPKRGTRRFSDSLTGLYDVAPIHPFAPRSPLLDRVLEPLHGLFAAFWASRLQAPLARADLVILESGAPLLLAGLCADFAPRARRIYRVNDDIALLNLPAFLVARETALARHCTRVSTASPLLAERFRDHPFVTLDPMGVPRAELQDPGPDPFQPRHLREVVCAGTTQLDMDALIRIATARPHWRLTVLGRLKTQPPRLPNLVFKGETSFADTLAHVAAGDIGLAPYRDAPGIAYQSTNSNRILLYRHFGLPILGPDRLCHPRTPSIIGYGRPDALEICETALRRPEFIPDWSELARALAQNEPMTPPIEVTRSPARVS